MDPNRTMQDHIDTTTISRQKLEIESLKSELAKLREVVREVVSLIMKWAGKPEEYTGDDLDELEGYATRLESAVKGK